MYMEKKIQRIGVVGCGNISGIYFANLTGMFKDRVKVTALTDLIPEKAEAASEKYGIPYIKKTEDLVNSPDVDVVLNITEPYNHYGVAMQALKAGKHVYGEKPLAAERKEADEMLALAKERGLYIGNGPDTFMGGGLQMCRKIIDDGWIGRPVAATAFMVGHGHESWHPGPEFYYKRAGGPLFDMGPYYINALLNMLGPVARLSGSAQASFKHRKITSQPLNGKIVDVEVPTHIAGTLEFKNGCVATMIMSFDVWAQNLPIIEIYGSEGTLRVPDPNSFGGPIYFKGPRQKEWCELPVLYGFTDNSRGLGITEMCEAISEGRPNRASSELAYHVLDIMCGLYDASANGRYYKLRSRCKRPEPMARPEALAF
jgi:predicted dehydrogenase